MLMFITILLAAGGMVAGQMMTRRGNPRGSAVTMVAALVGLTVAFARLLTGGGGAADHPVKVKEIIYAAIAAERLGLHLAEHHAGARAVVILPFELRTSEEHRAAMAQGLLKGLGDKVSVVRTIDPALPPAVKRALLSRYRSATMEQEDVPDFATWFDAAFLDQLLAESTAAVEPPTLIISLAGLPEDVVRLRALRTAAKPKLATISAPVHALHSLIARGDILAVVETHPSPNHEALPPREDVVTAFDRRFLLITPANLGEMKARYGGLF
jgi:hypothetical protein